MSGYRFRNIWLSLALSKERERNGLPLASGIAGSRDSKTHPECLSIFWLCLPLGCIILSQVFPSGCQDDSRYLLSNFLFSPSSSGKKKKKNHMTDSYWLECSQMATPEQITVARVMEAFHCSKGPVPSQARR